MYAQRKKLKIRQRTINLIRRRKVQTKSRPIRKLVKLIRQNLRVSNKDSSSSSVGLSVLFVYGIYLASANFLVWADVGVRYLNEIIRVMDFAHKIVFKRGLYRQYACGHRDREN